MCSNPLSKHATEQLAGQSFIRIAHWPPDRPRIRTYGSEGDASYSATRLIRSSEGRRLVNTLICCVLESDKTSFITSERICSSLSCETPLRSRDSPSRHT